MRALITGHAGFIGSALADRLVAEGNEVVGIDNLLTGRVENINPRVNSYKQDIRNIYLALKAVGGSYDLVIHCAASYDNPQKWHRDAETNVQGTIDVLLTAKAAECPIVYFQTALPPVSSYAITKTAGMQLIQQSGVPHLIFRLANIYGPRNLSGPVPTFFKRLTEGQPCTVVTTTRDMVYIDDLVDCVMLGIRNGARGVYDVCSGEQTEIAVLLELVADALDLPLDFESRSGDGDVKTQVSPLNGLPGWTPHTTLAEGVANAVEWYRANPPEKTYTHIADLEAERA